MGIRRAKQAIDVFEAGALLPRAQLSCCEQQFVAPHQHSDGQAIVDSGILEGVVSDLAFLEWRPSASPASGSGNVSLTGLKPLRWMIAWMLPSPPRSLPGVFPARFSAALRDDLLDEDAVRVQLPKRCHRMSALEE